MSSQAVDRRKADLRADIERTRAELGDTVQALVAKTDVKALARRSLRGTFRKARTASVPTRRRPVPPAVAVGAALAALGAGQRVRTRRR